MKFKKYCYLSALLTLTISSCSQKDGLDNNFEPTTYNVLGKVEKGPFVSGSTITIQPMDGNLQVLGSLYSTTIQDDLGNFSFGSKLFEAPYVELVANGYFFNEVDGQLSSGILSLRALVDLSDRTTVNVNLLTHLKYQRIQKLIANGMKFGEANKQAQKELFTAFGLQKYVEKDASTFSIAGGTVESAALITISSLLLVNRSEAAFTEYLAKLCRELGEKGAFQESTKQQINEDKKALWFKLPSIRDNIIKRYESLGLNVEVKDLERFIDWNNDGVAGNEVLQDGQEIKFETTELNVPNEGGVYNIGISSPIPIYLKPQSGPGKPDSKISSKQFFSEIYEGIVDIDIQMEKSLTNGILTVRIKPLHSKKPKISGIKIYDGLSNVVGNIKITQEGNRDISIPKLGPTGKYVVAAFAMNLALSLAELNLVEQYYQYNKEKDLVRQYVYPNSNTVHNIWENFYKANTNIMMFKDAEAKQLGVYQEYFNVFSAMQYYNMIIAWGDVPYIDSDSYMTDIYNIKRMPQNEILSDLKTNLENSIDYLEEKKNESLNNEFNDYFFLSKDVARILLANIHMYQDNYGQAEKLLEKVINNGFYKLDASNYNSKQTITDLFSNGSNKETIFATYSKSKTGRDVPIPIPQVVPIMTYTDVVLSYAECLYKNGMPSESEKQLSKVTTAKNINVSGNSVLEKIKNTRLQLMLYTNTNFAFMKRNNFAKNVYGVEEYRTLLPIPERQLLLSPQMSQNPGY